MKVKIIIASCASELEENINMWIKYNFVDIISICPSTSPYNIYYVVLLYKEIK
jgi:hypothetical protein